MITEVGRYRAGTRLYILKKYVDSEFGSRKSMWVEPYHRNQDIDEVLYWKRGDDIKNEDFIHLLNYLITGTKE